MPCGCGGSAAIGTVTRPVEKLNIRGALARMERMKTVHNKGNSIPVRLRNADSTSLYQEKGEPIASSQSSSLPSKVRRLPPVKIR